MAQIDQALKNHDEKREELRSRNMIDINKYDEVWWLRMTGTSMCNPHRMRTKCTPEAYQRYTYRNTT